MNSQVRNKIIARLKALQNCNEIEQLVFVPNL